MMTGVVLRWVAVGLWGIGLLAGCAAPPPPPSAATLDLLTVPKPQGPRAQAMTHYALAQAYLERDQPYIALEEIRRALEADPRFPQAYSLLGLVHLRNQATGLAQESFNRALDMATQPPLSGDDLGQVQHHLGWSQCQQGQYAQGQTQLVRALSQPGFTQAAEAWIALGDCQKMAGQQTQARNSWLQALRLAPQHPGVRARLDSAQAK